jgi:hypothetical protein
VGAIEKRKLYELFAFIEQHGKVLLNHKQYGDLVKDVIVEDNLLRSEINRLEILLHNAENRYISQQIRALNAERETESTKRGLAIWEEIHSVHPSDYFEYGDLGVTVHYFNDMETRRWHRDPKVPGNIIYEEKETK